MAKENNPGDGEILSAEQIAAMREEAARKRAENTKGAQKERAKNEELSDAADKEESRSRMLQGRLNIAPPKTGRESAEQKMARMPGTPNVREYLTPTRDPDTGAAWGLNAQLQKQIGNARTRISKNANHGIYLDALSEELGGRIAIAQREGRMTIPMFHIRQAQKHIAAHQEAHGRGDVDTAYDQMTQATDHLNEAANSALGMRAGDSEKGVGLRETDSEMDRSGFLKDDWNPKGAGYDAGMSLEGFHRQLNDVLTAYQAHYSEERGGIRPQVFNRISRNYAPGVTTPKTNMTPETAPEVTPRTTPKKPRVDIPKPSVPEETMEIARRRVSEALPKNQMHVAKQFHEMLGINEGNKIPLVDEVHAAYPAYQQHIKALFEGDVKPLPTTGTGRTIDPTGAEEGLVNAVAEAKANAEADEKNKRKKNKRQPMTYTDAMNLAKSDKKSSLFAKAPAKRTLQGDWITDTSKKPSTIDEAAEGAKERLGLGDDSPVGMTATRGARGGAFTAGHDGAKA